jgi:glucokinase
MQNNTYTIGIDLGATKIAFGVVDQNGKILNQIRLDTEMQKGYSFIKTKIANEVKELIKFYPKPAAVGIGVAGQIDGKTGMVLFAPNLKWTNVPLQNDLEQNLGIPCTVINDVRAAAWGEWLHGAGQGCNDVICLFIGTGVGGGVISNGQMLTGMSNSAGELGHITIDMHGPQCSCGNYGCLEAFVGGWAIAHHAKELIASNPKSGTFLTTLAKAEKEMINTKLIVQGYHKNDPLCVSIIAQVTKALIVGSVSLVNAFNPERIILGGGVVFGLPELSEWVSQGVRKLALPSAVISLKIIPSTLSEPGVVGAAAVARKLSNSKRKN